MPSSTRDALALDSQATISTHSMPGGIFIAVAPSTFVKSRSRTALHGRDLLLRVWNGIPITGLPRHRQGPLHLEASRYSSYVICRFSALHFNPHPDTPVTHPPAHRNAVSRFIQECLSSTLGIEFGAGTPGTPGTFHCTPWGSVRALETRDDLAFFATEQFEAA